MNDFYPQTAQPDHQVLTSVKGPQRHSTDQQQYQLTAINRLGRPGSISNEIFAMVNRVVKEFDGVVRELDEAQRLAFDTPKLLTTVY